MSAVVLKIAQQEHPVEGKEEMLLINIQPHAFQGILCLNKAGKMLHVYQQLNH